MLSENRTRVITTGTCRSAFSELKEVDSKLFDYF